MKLLPSLRQKKRYVVFEVISDKKFTFSEIREEVDKVLLLFFGQLGLAKTSPKLLKEKYKNNKFIIKINHQYVDELKSALMLSKKIRNVPVTIKSLITSGTLKKASGYL